MDLKEKDNSPGSLLFYNIELLSLKIQSSNNLTSVMQKNMFDTPNKKGFFELMYFLMMIIAPEKCQLINWPCVSKKDESKFRIAVNQFISEELLDKQIVVPPLQCSLIIAPYGRSVVHFLWKLSELALITYMEREYNMEFDKWRPNKILEPFKNAHINMMERRTCNNIEKLKSNQEMYTLHMMRANHKLQKLLMHLNKQEVSLKEELTELQNEIRCCAAHTKLECYVRQRVGTELEEGLSDWNLSIQQKVSSVKSYTEVITKCNDSVNKLYQNTCHLIDPNNKQTLIGRNEIVSLPSVLNNGQLVLQKEGCRLILINLFKVSCNAVKILRDYMSKPSDVDISCHLPELRLLMSETLESHSDYINSLKELNQLQCESEQYVRSMTLHFEKENDEIGIFKQSFRSVSSIFYVVSDSKQQPSIKYLSNDETKIEDVPVLSKNDTVKWLEKYTVKKNCKESIITTKSILHSQKQITMTSEKKQVKTKLRTPSKVKVFATPTRTTTRKTELRHQVPTTKHETSARVGKKMRFENVIGGVRTPRPISTTSNDFGFGLDSPAMTNMKIGDVSLDMEMPADLSTSTISPCESPASISSPSIATKEIIPMLSPSGILSSPKREENRGRKKLRPSLEQLITRFKNIKSKQEEPMIKE